MKHEPNVDTPSDLPPAEHDEALQLEEARQIEKMKQTHGPSHRTAGSATDLPKMNPDDD